ncbi:MAG: transcription elongation factor GreA [Alphaproteobacteria bacterium]
MVALLNQIKKILITTLGYNRLQDELRFLKTIERYKVIQAIAEARKHGDLSENAEYHAARDRQAFVEGRIIELEDKISRAEVIDVSKLSGVRVRFGATVTLFDEDTEEEITYQVVGEDEANIKEGLLSVSSPLAASLIGREKGEVFEVSTPRGGKSYEVISVVFK